MSSLLLVEDDDDFRESLTWVLRKRGFEVTAVENGREALDYLETATTLPNVIVLDLMMPVMDGWELARELEARPRLAQIPIVLLSGVADLAEQALACGAEHVIPKPVSLEKLKSILASYA